MRGVFIACATDCSKSASRLIVIRRSLESGVKARYQMGLRHRVATTKAIGIGSVVLGVLFQPIAQGLTQSTEKCVKQGQPNAILVVN